MWLEGISNRVDALGNSADFKVEAKAIVSELFRKIEEIGQPYVLAEDIFFDAGASNPTSLAELSDVSARMDMLDDFRIHTERFKYAYISQWPVIQKLFNSEGFPKDSAQIMLANQEKSMAQNIAQFDLQLKMHDCHKELLLLCQSCFGQWGVADDGRIFFHLDQHHTRFLELMGQLEELQAQFDELGIQG